MESPGTPFSLSNLLCDEDGASFLGSHDKNTSIDNTSISINSFKYEEEYIEHLFRKEIGFGSQRCFLSSNDGLKSARVNAIDWIFSTQEKLGFKIQTAYLSATYFDQFLSKKSMDVGKPLIILLLSAACLSLAAKMEETNVSLLSKYIVAVEIEEAKSNAKIEDCCFNNESIKKMELMILETLEWKMRSVTPFDYLHYFASKFCHESRSGAIVSKAVEHIMGIVKDVNLMDQRPSIIALAATMAAFDVTLTRKTMNLQISLLPPCVNLERERVFSFYNLMQEKEKERRKLLAPGSSILSSSFTCVLDNSCVTFGAKRKLNFEDSEENSPEKKLHRL